MRVLRSRVRPAEAPEPALDGCHQSRPAYTEEDVMFEGEEVTLNCFEVNRCLSWLEKTDFTSLD